MNIISMKEQTKLKGAGQLLSHYFYSSFVQGGNRMKQNYFYICRKHNFVRGLNADYSRVTISSSYMNGLTILELSRQATDEEVDHHELVFLCRGMSVDDERVRRKINKY